MISQRQESKLCIAGPVLCAAVNLFARILAVTRWCAAVALPNANMLIQVIWREKVASQPTDRLLINETGEYKNIDLKKGSEKHD